MRDEGYSLLLCSSGMKFLDHCPINRLLKITVKSLSTLPLPPFRLTGTHKSNRSSLALLFKEGTELKPLKIPLSKGDLGGSEGVGGN
jgi:hypothetical protein